MTPTPPSALLLAAAEAVKKLHREMRECAWPRVPDHDEIIKVLRPLLEERLARAEAFDALEAQVRRDGEVFVWCDLAMVPPHWQVTDRAGEALIGPTLASAIAAARGSG